MSGPRPYRSTGRASTGKPRRAGRLSCLQIGLLFFAVVLLALAAAVVLGYWLGVFEGLLSPEASDGAAIVPPLEEASQPALATSASVQTSILPTLDATETQAQATIALTSTIPVASPTVTLTPPATAPVEVCAQLDLRFLNATSTVAAWRVGNASGEVFTLSRIEIAWPASNDAIFNAFLDGKVIWSGTDITSPTFITAWMGTPEERSLDSPARLEFFFGTAAASSGYDLTVWFTNGCEVSSAN